jgi:hypothetical protein
MNRFTKDKLNLNPRSDDELHSAVTNFELKWESKARRALGEDRISRF